MKLNVLFSALLLSVAFYPLFSQIPTVTAIQPEFGPVGTSLTITGSNFETASSTYEVYFGTIRAVINAVTPNAITVTVPPGTVHDAPSILVKTSGRKVSAPRPFITTFAGSGEITAASFLTRVDLSVGVGSKPNHLTAGDVDGDGNVDIVTANTGANTIVIFRNLKTDTAPVTASTFASPVSFASGYAASISLADLDGDGKPELIAINTFRGTVTILQNNSTVGEISFLPPVELPASGGVNGVAIGDLNGDGRPDIVATSNDSFIRGRVVVFQNNILHPGSAFTASSFSAGIILNAGSDARDVMLGDIDGDGLQDIVVACIEGPEGLQVLRNLGYTSISPASFATSVGFYAGTGPVSVALTDVDRDGKLDVVTANTHSYTLCLNRNLSVAGSPFNTSSLSPRQQYSTGFQPMRVVVGDFDGDGFPDAATANNHSTNNVAIFENSNVPGSPLTNSFFSKIDLKADGACTGIVSADFNGDGLPDLATSNTTAGTVSIFVNNNFKNATPPKISSFSPLSGTFHDEVTIIGQNFSTRPTNNLVKFNGVHATVISSTATTLKVTVPPLATTGKISVSVNGFETTFSANDFIVFQVPTITDFAPSKGPVGTSVTIRGKNFGAEPSENIVFFGAVRAVVISASADELTVVVPKGATYQEISVSVHAMVAYSSQPFTVTFPGGPLTTAMFSNRVEFASGTTFSKDVAVGDLDGDGKPDILMGGQTGGVAVFRNTSEGGPITNSTLATKTVIPGTSDANQLEVHDLDLDGKLDLILCTSGAIQFFRNKSVIGNILFYTPVTLQTQGQANLVVADIDLDGKPDLVYGTGYYSNEVFVARNTTIQGRPLSFAPPVGFQTSSNCFDLTVADIDRDGKVDIVFPKVSNENGIAVLRNQSTPLTIDADSFAPAVVFQVTSRPQSIAKADFNGDGKIDLAASNYGYGGLDVLSVLQNTSVAGSISNDSFTNETVWRMPSESYATHAADLDGDGKPEIILAVCGSTCTVTAFRNISTPGASMLSSFEAGKDLAATDSQYILEIGDFNGDGRPEIIASVQKSGDIYDLVILENKSTNPYATSFSPSSGPAGTIVTIAGHNFNTTPELNHVWFNMAPAEVVTAASNSLTVIVPSDASTGLISISANGLISETATPFSVTHTEQSITFNALSSVFVNHGQITLKAIASSGLAVVYESSNPNVATVEDNIITIESAGTTIITAQQPGDSHYGPAVPVSRELVVNKIPQVITFTELAPRLIDEGPVVLTGTSSSGLPVDFTSSDEGVATVVGNDLRLTGPGITTITALQAGDAIFLEAPPVEQQLVVKMVTGIDNTPVRASLFLTPNPVVNRAIILLDDLNYSHVKDVKIYDVSGRIITSRSFVSNEEINIDMTSAPNGIYLLKLHIGVETHVIRFSVAR